MTEQLSLLNEVAWIGLIGKVKSKQAKETSVATVWRGEWWAMKQGSKQEDLAV